MSTSDQLPNKATRDQHVTSFLCGCSLNPMSPYTASYWGATGKTGVTIEECNRPTK